MSIRKVTWNIQKKCTKNSHVQEEIPKVEYEITVNVLKNIWFILQQQKQYCFSFHIFFMFIFFILFFFIEWQTSAGSLYIFLLWKKGRYKTTHFIYSVYSLYCILVNKKGQQKKMKKLPTIEYKYYYYYYYAWRNETKRTKHKRENHIVKYVLKMLLLVL